MTVTLYLETHKQISNRKREDILPNIVNLVVKGLAKESNNLWYLSCMHTNDVLQKVTSPVAKSFARKSKTTSEAPKIPAGFFINFSEGKALLSVGKRWNQTRKILPENQENEEGSETVTSHETFVGDLHKI